MSEAKPSGRLQGRRIVITGAASGIGRRTAQLFAAESATLALLDRNAEALAEIGHETGGHVFAADVTDDDAMKDAIQNGAAAMGGIDGLVTCAGVMARGNARETPTAEWWRTVEINLKGTFIAAHHCLPFMEQAETASIVTLSSGQGLLPNVSNRTAYAASKAGVVGLTRALAAELAPSIRVNCVAPGLVDTPMAQGVRGNFNNYALGRLADPLEIANALLFLTSSDASYITGATLAVDGGRTFH
jgi:NAD(P)-dependent dehydrogenase (short-subunit alcohol dehydrogenase family)